LSNIRLADAISQSSILKMQLHCPKSSISGPKTTVHIPKLALYSMEYLHHNIPIMRYCQISAEIERNVLSGFRNSVAHIVAQLVESLRYKPEGHGLSLGFFVDITLLATLQP